MKKEEAKKCWLSDYRNLEDNDDKFDETWVATCFVIPDTKKYPFKCSGDPYQVIFYSWILPELKSQKKMKNIN